MNQEVLLVASSTEGNITAWDVHTGTALTTYKTNACPPNGISLLGRDYLIATQSGKPALHAWTWHKDQVHQRSFPPEPITALACTSDGVYCAAGGLSGAVHIWEVTSGRLLRSWPCHYKKVTCLAFTDSGTELVTGGEDTLVTAWLLAEVLDVAAPAPQLGGSSLSPLHSWSDHTLPISAVSVGAGTGGNALVFSASADRTLKIRNLGTGILLRSIAFPAPLTSLVVDPGEHAVYAGSAHGTIYDVALVSAGGSAAEQGWTPMEGHSQAVTCLAVSSDAGHLVSGSEDTSVTVWDLRSRQPVRTLTGASKGPVSSVLLLQRPEFMPAGAGSGRKGPQRLQPLAQLSKYPGQTGGLKPWEGGLVLLDGSGVSGNGLLVEREAGEGTAGRVRQSEPGKGAGEGEKDKEGEEGGDLEALREENAKLKVQAERAMALAQQWGAQNAKLQQELLLRGGGS